jgi:hypothetical protein
MEQRLRSPAVARRREVEENEMEGMGWLFIVVTVVLVVVLAGFLIYGSRQTTKNAIERGVSPEMASNDLSARTSPSHAGNKPVPPSES